MRGSSTIAPGASVKDVDPKASLFGQPRALVEAALAEREPVRCPLCDVDPKPFATDSTGFHLARCPRCRLEFQSPRPLFSALAERVYAHHYEDLSEAAAELTPEKRFLLARQLDGIESLRAGRGPLLDVGCGAGAFLRYARERGWSVAGTDIELSSAAQAAGFQLWQGQLSEIGFGEARFDALRFHHVLEHTQNPLTDLRRARSLLRAGGVLYLSVPNLAGLGPRLKSWQSRFGLKAHRWRHYAALHHLWYFTPGTLARVVERAGFRVLRWETPLPPRPQRSAWLTSIYRALLEKPRWGSILDLYARKPG
ncbi:MAG: class I SAM-dependent methyltransferase [Terriglobia bacterium]